MVSTVDVDLFSVSLHGLAEGRHRHTLIEGGEELSLPGSELTSAGEVELELTLDRTGSLLTARGTVSTRVNLVCARCLEAFGYVLEGEFETALRLGPDTTALDDAGDTPVITRDDRISFAPSVREALILAVPMKPLCTPGCRGLCPQCGANLNTTTCSCEAAPADSRWAALQDLREKM